MQNTYKFNILDNDIEIPLPHLFEDAEVWRAEVVRKCQIDDVVYALKKSVDRVKKLEKKIEEDQVDVFLKELEVVVASRVTASEWLRTRATPLLPKMIRKLLNTKKKKETP